ncbi:MAG: sulfotransferase [Cyanobacteria bacterium J06639_14]
MAQAVAQLIKQGVDLQNRGRVIEAGQIYQRVLAAEPHHASALHLSGTVAFFQNDFETAISQISQAIERSPNHAVFHHNLAGALCAVGRFDEARHHYWNALHLRPDYAEAFFNFAEILNGTDQSVPLSALENLLAQPSVKSSDRSFLHFAAGKWYDDRGEYDRAFFHYREGNAQLEDPFDPEALDAYVDELITVFNREMLTQRFTEGFENDLLVFIMGMPRSGTTLIEHVMAAHTVVFGAGELPYVNSISAQLTQYSGTQHSYPTCVRSVPAATLRGLGRALIDCLRPLSPQAFRIVDKYPLNFFHAGLLTLLLPNARIVHCRRNALDTCLSCYFKRFRSSHQAFSNNLVHLGRYYRAYERLMTHWRHTLPNQMFEVDYKAMVTDHEATCRKLIDFIGLTWDPQCLRAHETKRTVTTASQLQVRQPVYRSSLDRWRNYEKHLGPLQTALYSSG